MTGPGGWTAPAPAPARDPRGPDPTRRLAAAAILGAFLVPTAVAGRGPVLCPVRRATGLPCPACGLTRSWSAALHGRPVASLRFHPLGILALAGAGAYGAGLDRRLDGVTRDRAQAAWPLIVGAWLAVWLVRVAAEARRRR